MWWASPWRSPSPQENVSRSPGVSSTTSSAQRADAQLGARQVLQDRDLPSGPARGVAHAADGLRVLLQRAVRVVQPRHVHPGGHHPRERLRLARGGADRGDDLRVAHCRKVSTPGASCVIGAAA